MTRAAAVAALAVAACTPAAVHAPREASCAGSAHAAFDRDAYLQDLDALTADMSSHYANLDYAVRVRRLDLPAVLARARARLRAATTDDQAHRAFKQFLNAFGDAHLDIEWSPRAEPASAPGTGSLCARLGYAPPEQTGVSRPGVEFARVVSYTPASDADAADIPGGVVELGVGHRLGVVRIGVFMETAHPALCELARADLHLADDAACDDDCSDRVEIAVADRLTAAVERRVAALAAAGVGAIAVDLTGNGGGTNWVQPVLRTLTAAHLPALAFDVVRHPHWVKPLGDEIAALEQESAAHGDLPHGELAAAIAAHEAVLAEVRAPCDRGALWTTVDAAPACTQLARVPPVLAYAAPGELAARGNRAALFPPSLYRYREGVNRLPLAVLVDGGTASAAEDFAAQLQDAHAALIVGSTTAGAGCGFTNGGIATVLPRSRASVKLPDCVRLRADGSNAVAGVTPDVALPLLDRDSPFERATKLVAGLRDAWPRIVH
jgi:hypothetical protein|nr:S41 family peptidase [Kofleriaceae bacterium]